MGYEIIEDLYKCVWILISNGSTNKNKAEHAEGI